VKVVICEEQRRPSAKRARISKKEATPPGSSLSSSSSPDINIKTIQANSAVLESESHYFKAARSRWAESYTNKKPIEVESEESER